MNKPNNTYYYTYYYNQCLYESNVTRAWDLEKIRIPIEFQPMTFWTPGGCSIHWTARTHGEPGHFTIYHYLSHMLNPAGGRRRMSCKNSVKWPGSPWVLVAQWIEHPPGVQNVMGSNPIGTQTFSRSHARVTLLSYIYLPSFNFTITHLSHNQCYCHYYYHYYSSCFRIYIYTVACRGENILICQLDIWHICTSI